MKTLTIHNIPEDLMEKMERRASANGRAVEEEALNWLQIADNGRATPGIQPIARKRTPEELAELDLKIRRLRESMPMIHTDDEEINRYKMEGRPGERTPEEAAELLAESDRVRRGMTMIPKGEADLNRCNCEGRL